MMDRWTFGVIGMGVLSAVLTVALLILLLFGH
jgi:hypothetical protein